MDTGTHEGKTNIEAVKAMQTRLAKATWKDNWEKVLKATEWDRRLLRPGDKATNAEGDVYAGYEGMYFISASNTRRSEEHTSELQSRGHLVCRLLLEKKNLSIKFSCR